LGIKLEIHENPSSTVKWSQTLTMNKNTNSSLLFAILLVVSIFMGGLPTVGQEPTDALRRGYRAGYTDGYMSGYKDISEGLSREIRRHSEYSTADRTYTAEFGKLEDFQDGYRQGFEKGYAHGFERKPFDSSLPTGLSRRGNVEPSMAVVATVPPPTPASPDEDEEEGVEEEFEEEEVEEEVEEEEVEEEEPPALPTPTPEPTPRPTPEIRPSPTPLPTPVVQPTPTPTPQFREPVRTVDTEVDEVLVRKDTVLILEMEGRLNTDASVVGDSFRAKVVSPLGLTGAIVDGRVAKIRKPGRIFRRAELTLVFDRITFKDGRSTDLVAILTEVLPVKSDNVRTVDSEGTVEGKVFDRGDGVRITAVTGSAAAVGAIVAGPGGAVVGAGIGAIANVASTLSRRGKDITIHPLQQLRIRTTTEIRLK
jgi:hypothetical protein